MKFRIGDNIKITAGKDRGRDGKIEKVFPKTFKVLVPGVNLYKKHVKGSATQKGGIYDIPRPLGLGKIALICPKCKNVTRIGFSIKGEKKARICKKCLKEIDVK